MEIVKDYFEIIVQWIILLIEFIGVCTIVFTVGRSVAGIIKKDVHVQLRLAQGIALALEFKMGGEVLRTVIVREWSELAVLGVIVLLRAAMSFLLRWEIRNEEERLQ